MKQLSWALKSQINIGHKSSKETLADELDVQYSQKHVYINSLKEIEEMMRNEHQEIRKLLPEVIEQKVMSSRYKLWKRSWPRCFTFQKKEMAFDLLDLFSAFTGFIFGVASADSGAVISSVTKVSCTLCVKVGTFMEYLKHLAFVDCQSIFCWTAL